MSDIAVRRGGCGPDCVEGILRGLPEWFGIEAALVEYVEQARVLPTYAAVADGRAVGVALVRRHSEHAAEIVLLAVARTHHRRGIGRRLLARIEADLAGDGVEFLQAKTLGLSHPAPEYEHTRRFYAAVGFRALEELEGLWPDNPCLLMVKHLPAAVRDIRP